MNKLKEYEEEIKKGCGEMKERYKIAQTIPLHKDFVPSVNTIINYEILQAKLEAIQKCKEIFKEMIKEKLDYLENFVKGDSPDRINLDSFKGLIKNEIYLTKRKLLSQLNEEDLKEKEE